METINIDGKNYQISFVDTEDTIKNMIAVEKNMFADHIRFTIFNLQDSDVQIETLSEQLDELSITDLAETAPELAKEWKSNVENISCEWLRLNRNGKIDVKDYELIDIFKKIDDAFWSENATKVQCDHHNNRLKQEQTRLKALIKKEAKFRKEYTKYTAINTTKFLQDSVIIEYQITIDLDPLEAFDSINLDTTIPFVRLKTITGANDQVYYKLQKNVIPDNNWLEGDTTFTFKLSPTDEKDEWNTATIQYIGDVAPYEAIMVIESSVAMGKGSEEKKIQNAILGIFTGANIKITERQEKGIKGVFAIPDTRISRAVFLDLVTNDPAVSHYLYVDETRELSSQKGVLYLYFSPGETLSQVLTVFVSEKEVSRSDPFYIEKELLLFTPYLNVRVSRALNLNQINRFKHAFAVILDIYRVKFDSIVKDYNKMIPGFKAENTMERHRTVADGKRLKELQAQDSELFIYGYPTKCEKKKQPIPIKKNTIKKWETKKHQIMNYPKGSTNFFVCPDDAFKFPGLLKNKYANSDEYAYLPCCYPENQKVGRKKWNVYLKDIGKVSRGKTSNIVTKKAVEENKLGFLPRNVYYILSENAKPEEEFLRQGVAIGKNSFIAAVLLAMDSDYETVEDKKTYVQDFRNNLASQDITSVVQQLYDVDAKKIVKDILDPEIPFDSEIFVGLLEAKYNCQIVVFTRTDQQPNGEFEIPRYTQGYLFNRLTPGKNTVLIYKHTGSRSDNLEYPHYELIVMRYKKITTWYFSDTNFIRNIYSHFLRSYRLYIIGIGRYAPVPILFPDADGQIIDRYGKCRGYTFGKDDSSIYIATSPLSPVANIIAMDTPEERPAWNKVRAFIKKHKLTLLKQDVVDGKAIGVTIDLPGVPYSYIPFSPTKKLDGIVEGKHLGYSVPTEDDILQQTVENRKIANYLMQLLLYNFSLWFEDQQETAKYKKQQVKIDKLTIGLKQNKGKAILMNLVERYLREKIVLIPDHDYAVDSLPRRLTLNNSFFKNDKLIVNSQETRDRLGYYIRFTINKNKAMVIRYSEKIYLDNYYTFGADFSQHVGQLIFIGGLSISNWIESQRHGISNQTHIVPHPDTTDPFFFTHWALNGGKPVIIQNVKYGSKARALAVAAEYERADINIGYDATPVKELTHGVYYFDGGELMRDGTSKIKIWRYAEDFYAAILVP